MPRGKDTSRDLARIVDFNAFKQHGIIKYLNEDKPKPEQYDQYKDSPDQYDQDKDLTPPHGIPRPDSSDIEE